MKTGNRACRAVAGLPVAMAAMAAMAAAAVWGCSTIDHEPDAETLPSSVLEAPSPLYRETVEEGRTLARSLVAEEKLPGLSLAVAVDGKIVWAEGFGWADLEDRTPVTPATLFRIGGISETLTATAAGLLSQHDRLDLDAPVQSYLPAFPTKEWPVSTRQLMAHTAGIRPHRGEAGIFIGASCADDAERLAMFADAPLSFRPGTESRYSTHGWVLVGAVVAATAGEPYHDFMRREIFAPLGMTSTTPEIAGVTEPGQARFYYPSLMLDPRRGLQDAPEVDLSCYGPAVGFLSTPSDLVRFGSAMMAEGLLAPEMIDELQRPVQLESGEHAGRALGWTVLSASLRPDSPLTRLVGQGFGEVVRRRPLSAVSIGGQVAGSTALLLTIPEHRIALAVTSNVSGAKNVSVLSTRLADAFIRLRMSTDGSQSVARRE